jgi:hypothetical protein
VTPDGATSPLRGELCASELLGRLERQPRQPLGAANADLSRRGAGACASERDASSNHKTKIVEAAGIGERVYPIVGEDLSNEGKSGRKAVYESNPKAWRTLGRRKRLSRARRKHERHKHNHAGDTNESNALTVHCVPRFRDRPQSDDTARTLSPLSHPGEVRVFVEWRQKVRARPNEGEANDLLRGLVRLCLREGAQRSVIPPWRTSRACCYERY